jgi:penicillin-binding protein 2
MNRVKKIHLRLIPFIISPLLIFWARLAQLQLIYGDKYRKQMSQQKISLKIIPSSRGKILDRSGHILCMDTHSFDLYMIPDKFDRDKIQLISKISGIDYSSHKSLLKRIQDSPPKCKNKAYLILSDLAHDQAIAIETHPECFPGLKIKRRRRRIYPYGYIGAHVLGFVGKAWRDKLELNKLIKEGYFFQPSQNVSEYMISWLVKTGKFDAEIIGRDGIELFYNDHLRRRLGLKAVEYNRPLNQHSGIILEEPQDGQDIYLTLEIGIQEVAQRILKGHRGAAIVMDITNGDILALASNPAFDPGKLTPEVFNDPAGPFLNRAIAGRYPLGSIFKIITAVSALETKRISPATSFLCSGKFSDTFPYFRCWIYKQNYFGHGELSLVEGMERSCNIFFFKIGKAVGTHGLITYAQMFGLGKKTGIDLAGERSGYLPKDYNLLSETLNLSIGQGDLLVTPIQAVQLLAIIANGGFMVQPRLFVKRKVYKKAVFISLDTLKAIRRGLWLVVHGRHGTAHNSGLARFDTAGKTSTAETGGGSRSAHAWFAGFFPFRRPKYAYLVLIEHGGNGIIAARKAAKLVEKLSNLR